MMMIANLQKKKSYTAYQIFTAIFGIQSRNFNEMFHFDVFLPADGIWFGVEQKATMCMLFQMEC